MLAAPEAMGATLLLASVRMPATAAGMLGDFGARRFYATLTCVVILGLSFAWSIWSMRPFRIGRGFRLRKLMAVIAILPLEWNGGTVIWNRWEQWECDRGIAACDAFCVAMAAEKVRTGDKPDIEVLDTLPDRPITGERTVSADGTIDPRYYGKVKIAGLTMKETKERIVLHLRE